MHTSKSELNNKFMYKNKFYNQKLRFQVSIIIKFRCKVDSTYFLDKQNKYKINSTPLKSTLTPPKVDTNIYYML